MTDHPVLRQVLLGYSAVLDRNRAVAATRLTVVPADPAAAVDADALRAVLAEVWPAAGGAELSLRLRPMGGSAAKAAGGQPTAGAKLVLNVASEPLLRALLAGPPMPNALVEVPAFLLADAELAAAVQAQAQAAGTLALKGAPREPLAAALLDSFALQIDDVAMPLPKAAPGSDALPRLRTGARAPADVDAALAAHCTAVAGWPFGDAPTAATGKSVVAPELQVIMELIKRVDREEPADRLEAVLKNDPTLAFRLLRYINSPGFGLSVEVSSFQHALMMLGYQRLKRWLALLLTSASKDVAMKPLMYAAVRRGLFFEELVRGSGDAEMRGEIFICGVFSLLDRLLKQPFAELLKSVPVPESVRQALGDGEGPFAPYLSLIEAIEQESGIDIRECAAQLMIGPAEVNRALCAAWKSAAQLE